MCAYIQFPDTTHTFAHLRLNIEKRALKMPFLCAQLDEAFFHYPQRIDMQIFAGIGNLSDLEVLRSPFSEKGS